MILYQLVNESCKLGLKLGWDFFKEILKMTIRNPEALIDRYKPVFHQILGKGHP